MADSNLTKKALAKALKELMEEVPFDKINVAQICEKCNMKRKSFYYHFKDKYDLVNWIFDTEIISIVAMENLVMEQLSLSSRWEMIDNFCQAFYKNRNFYRKALKIKGQNSFSDHFRKCIQPLLKKRLTLLAGKTPLNEFTINFFSDACICAIERWLLEKNCMTPEQFTALLKNIIEIYAVSYKEMKETDTL